MIYMCCHGELERAKPSTEKLTAYYLMMSLGGACGGMFSALLSPYVFNDFYEYDIALLGCFVTVTYAIYKPLFKSDFFTIKKDNDLVNRRFLRWIVLHVAIVTLGAMLYSVGDRYLVKEEGIVETHRNFYGILTIKDFSYDNIRLDKRSLYHGHIQHGFQYKIEDKRAWPSTYYGEDSGIGIAIRKHPKRKDFNYPFRLGVIGLGVGTLVSYGNNIELGYDDRLAIPDTLELYEINPGVLYLADKYFTFIDDAIDRGSQVNVHLGDARIVMERQLEKPMQFDVLAVDAFSGDSVPIHLLTRECFDIYTKHMKPDGIIAYHISNRYVDLLPVIAKLADEKGYTVVNLFQKKDEYGHSENKWIVLTKNKLFLEREDIKKNILKLDEDKLVLWTDDFSSLFDVLEED